MNPYNLPAGILLLSWAWWLVTRYGELGDTLFRPWRQYVWYSRKDRYYSLALWGYVLVTVESVVLAILCR